MRHSLEALRHAAGENFAAPDGAVVAVARAVETHTQHGLSKLATLRQHRGHVSAVMLNRELFRGGQSQRILAGGVFRVRIMRHQEVVPAHAVHGDEVLDGFLEGAESFVVVEVANVLADKCLAIDDESDGVLQVGADGQQRTARRQSGDRAGSVTARPAQDYGSEGTDPNYGIIHAPRDGALADQERIGQTRQAVEARPRSS